MEEDYKGKDQASTKVTGKNEITETRDTQVRQKRGKSHSEFELGNNGKEEKQG